MFWKVIIILLYIKNVYCFGEISQQKCQEYGKAVYTQEDSPVLLVHPVQNTVSQCGIVSVPLIVGGVKAQTKEFPHMAVIGFGPSPNGDLAWQCGGALISNLFILTAAHCLQSKDKGLAQKVKLGSIDLATPEEDSQEKIIIQRIPHPNYHPPLKYNDIALIRLESPVQFSPYVRPACLNTFDVIRETKALATGFGKTSYDAFAGSQYLMKVLLNLIPNGNCANSFASEMITMPNGLANSMLCAGENNGGKDTCQGDSGGPLQIVLREPYCMYSLIGVTSFGKFCGFANSPAVYTKISNFIPWIESIVWN